MSLQEMDPEQMLTLDLGTVKQAMEIIFRVLGPNVEKVARLTAYWSDDMSDMKGAAKQLCCLFKRYKILKQKITMIQLKL